MQHDGPDRKIEAERPRGRAYRLLRAIGPLRKAVRGFRERVYRYRVPVWYLEGTGRVAGLRLSMVFAGHPPSKNYFAHLAFERGYSERFLGEVWLWNVRRVGLRRQSDLIVTHEWTASRESSTRRKGFCMPCWIGTEIEIGRAAELCRTSENIKSDVRRLIRNGLTYEITKNPVAMENFYSSMYVPYVERAHGGRTMLTPWEEFATELDRAELMLLRKDGEIIAANLLVDLGGGRARTRAVGVKDGDQEYVKLGAVAALYYFEIMHLREQGYDKLHYGASRPFLKDGVLGFKKKYGARIVDKDRRIFRMRVTRYSDGVKAFLRNNPFVSEQGGRFYANFFVNRSADVGGASLREQLSRHRVEGLAAARVYSLENARGVLDAAGRPAEPAFVEFRHGA